MRHDDWADDDDVRQELLAEGRLQRRYRAALLRHPDPRDPDHPEPPDTNEEED